MLANRIFSRYLIISILSLFFLNTQSAFAAICSYDPVYTWVDTSSSIPGYYEQVTTTTNAPSYDSYLVANGPYTRVVTTYNYVSVYVPGYNTMVHHRMFYHSNSFYSSRYGSASLDCYNVDAPIGDCGGHGMSGYTYQGHSGGYLYSFIDYVYTPGYTSWSWVPVTSTETYYTYTTAYLWVDHFTSVSTWVWHPAVVVSSGYWSISYVPVICSTATPTTAPTPIVTPPPTPIVTPPPTPIVTPPPTSAPTATPTPAPVTSTTWSITFIPANGQGNSTISYTNGSPVLPNAPLLLRSGYTFTGWSPNLDSSTLALANRSYTALWSKDVIKVRPS